MVLAARTATAGRALAAIGWLALWFALDWGRWACLVGAVLNLVGVLTKVAGKSLGQPVALEHQRIMRLPQFKFTHGNAAVAGRVLLFFYFEELDTGLMALIPGVQGGTEVARFRLSGLAAGNPKQN